MTIIIALSIATLIPVVVFFLVRKADAFETGNLRFMVASFIWGITAYFLAAQINPSLIDQGIANHDSLVRFYAPIIEEILKVLIIFYFIRQASFTYFVDGTLFGFAIGIGFAVVENWEYVLANPNSAVFQAVARVISTNLMHATATAALGIALGQARMQRSGRKNILILSGFLIAIGIHMAFNNLVTRVNSGLLLLYAATAGIGGAVFIYTVIRRGFQSEQKEMEENLNKEEGITAQEASAVQQVDQMKKFLAPVVEKFGSDKAQQVEKFLRMQAKLAILRKSAARFAEIGDEKLHHSTDKQIETLRTEMNGIRRSVGSYCMLYLRGTFLQESSPLWGRLQGLIEERAKAPRQSNAPSLWGNLDTKIKTE